MRLYYHIRVLRVESMGGDTTLPTKVDTGVKWYLKEKTEGLREKLVPVPLYPLNPWSRSSSKYLRIQTAPQGKHFIKKINLLTFFKEIISVYTENHTKYKNIKCKATDC
jgi:hypothetical protein